MSTIDITRPHAPERGYALKDYAIAYGSSWFWHCAPIFAMLALIKAPGEWLVLPLVVAFGGGIAFLGGATSGALLFLQDRLRRKYARRGERALGLRPGLEERD